MYFARGFQNFKLGIPKQFRIRTTRSPWLSSRDKARNFSNESAQAKSNFRPTWTTGRVMTVVAATASITYIATSAYAQLFAEKKSHNLQTPRYANPAELQQAVSAIKIALGENAISIDEDELHRHGFSEWSSANSDRLPVAIVYPRSTKDVSEIAKICNEYRVPLVPYCAGSSIEGNFSSPFGGITVDFMFMDKIVALHPNDMDVVCQPAVPWMKLNDEIKSEGLFFPVDPSPTAQIGGMVGTNGSGTNTVRYGTMRDWVINLTVVLADGTIVKTRKRPRKSSAGYNLTHLFVGSEGTLGIVTEITLKLAVVPDETSVAVVTFPTIHDAASAASSIMRAGVPVAAMEFMDDVQMRIVNASGTTSKTWEEVPTMFFKFSGTKAGVRDNINVVEKIAKSNGCNEFHFATDTKEKDALWSARKEALWATLAMRQHEAEIWRGTDVAVPLSKLPELIDITKEDLKGLGLFGASLGHVGDGNFHVSLLYRPDLPDQRDAAEHFVHQMIDRALELEGTCTGEHGVGIGKKDALLEELGTETVNTMKNIKLALDPRWILNPGKVFDF